MTEEVLLKWSGKSSSAKLDKDGNLIETFKVKLEDDKKHYTLVIRSSDETLFDKYPDDCEIPIQLNKTSQTKLEP